MKKNKSLTANLFGFHAVRAAWLNPQRNIHAAYVSQKSMAGFEQTMREAQDMGLKRVEPVILDPAQFAAQFDRLGVHQGLVMNAQDLPERDLHDLIIQEATKSASRLLILDQVTDPHNVGAILRSACAFGAGGVIMQSKHAPDLTGVLAKTACGAVDLLPVIFEINLARTINTLQESGYMAYGMDEHTHTTIDQAPAHDKMVMVLGAEGTGMRRLVAENCDLLVKLPTLEPLESLNVSNAAAIALYATRPTEK